MVLLSVVSFQWFYFQWFCFQWFYFSDSIFRSFYLIIIGYLERRDFSPYNKNSMIMMEEKKSPNGQSEEKKEGG